MTLSTESRARRDQHLLVLAGILVLATILRFYALGRQSLWFDEAFSVNVADWDPLWIITRLTEIGLRSTDRNLYNLILHYWILLGRSEAMVRSLSAVCGVLSVLVLYCLSKRLLGQRVALASAFLLAVSPAYVYYSQEARPYVLLTLIGLLTGYFMLRALSDNRASSWLGYVLLAACATYTHSFGLLIIGALNLFALIHLITHREPRRSVLAWLAAQALVAASLLPFLRSMTGQASQGWGSWIGDRYGVPTLKSLSSTMGLFSFGTAYDQHHVARLVGLVVFAIPCLITLYAMARNARRPGGWDEQGEPLAFALIYLVAPIAVLFVASQITPLYLERYLLPFLPAYLIIVGYGVLAISQPVWRRLLSLALLLVMLPALLGVYLPGQKEDWRDGAAYVAAHAGQGDLIVYYDAYVSIPFDYYYKADNERLFISRGAPDDEVQRRATEIASSPRTVWLVLSHVTDTRVTDALAGQPSVMLKSTQPFLGLDIVEYEVRPPQ